MLTPPESFVEPEPTEPRAPQQGFWLLNLFLRPGRFFTHFPHFATTYATVYTALIVGVVGAMDEIEERAIMADFGLRDQDSLIGLLRGSWGIYWGFSVALGLIGAIWFYRVGGWWYRTRLTFCGAVEPDALLSRRVYIFACLIMDLPGLCITVIDSMLYETPAAAANGDQWWYLVLLGVPFWSIYVSYRGVRTLFETVRWKAIVWFMVLPSVMYSSFILGIIAFFMFAEMPPPDVANPTHLEQPGFVLRYPGNWWIDETAEDYDPGGYFAIEPFQDAFVLLNLFEGGDASEGAAESVAHYESEFHVKERGLFTEWGAYEGSGTKLIGSYAGTSYVVRVFGVNHAESGLIVVEMVAESIVDDMEPGFDLIRRSFRFKE